MQLDALQGSRAGLGYGVPVPQKLKGWAIAICCLGLRSTGGTVNTNRAPDPPLVRSAPSLLSARAVAFCQSCAPRLEAQLSFMGWLTQSIHAALHSYLTAFGPKGQPAVGLEKEMQHSCLMRSRSLEQPGAWRRITVPQALGCRANGTP